MAIGGTHSNEPSAREAAHAAVSGDIGERERAFAAPAVRAADGEPGDRDIDVGGEGVTARVEAAFEHFTRALSEAFADAQGGQSAQAATDPATPRASVPPSWSPEEIALAWLALAKRGVCANLAALNDLSRCRSAPDLVEWHTWLVREQLQIVSEAGDVVVRATTGAFEQAGGVLQRTSGAPPRGE